MDELGTLSETSSHERELGGVISDYLSSHTVCTMAVSDGKNPSAHTVYYVSRGLRLYFQSDSQSQKIHVLRANPKVGYTVDEDYDDWSKIKGVQAFGRARVIGEDEAVRIRELFTQKFPQVQDIGGIPEAHDFVEIIPEKIYFLDYTKSFGKRDVLYIEDSKSLLKW